ncbi:hypothetical protein MRX96_013904 [Rhipicephalus microplus]
MEAMLMSPQIVAHRPAARLRLNGVLQPWQTSGACRGLRIDHRLTWVPANRVLLAKTTQAKRAVLRVQTNSNGGTTRWALRLFDAAAVSHFRHALPLVALPTNHLKLLEVRHRGALRMFLGIPRSSQIPATHAEAGSWLLPLTLL